MSAIPADNIDTLFAFGRRSREALSHYIATLPAEGWDAPVEITVAPYRASMSPRKIMLHVLTHEIRHWAQIATLLRLNGLSAGFRDFLFSPVLGGEIESRSH